jgi:hypothetical protein
MAKVIIADADDVRIKFEATVQRVGSGLAKTVFSRAMNTEGRKSYVAVKRAVAKQTSIKVGDVARSMSFKGARPNALETRVIGKGRHFPLSYFGAKQFSFGVRAKVWGEFHKYPHAFVVKAYGGNVYKRLSAKRFPIKQLWGPAIPVEMVKDETLASWQRGVPDVSKEAMRLLGLMISGKVK